MAAAINKQIAGPKGAETLEREDYANENEAFMGLSSFGRAVPYSFDVGISRKFEP